MGNKCCRRYGEGEQVIDQFTVKPKPQSDVEALKTMDLSTPLYENNKAAEHLLQQSREPTHLFTKERNKFWFVVFALYLYQGCAGGVVPNAALSSLHGGVNPCLKYGKSSEICTSSLQTVTEWISMITSVSNFSMFLAAPLVGALADVIGRLPMLAASLFVEVALLLVLLGAITNLCSIYVFFWINILDPYGILDVVTLLVISDLFPVEDFGKGVAAATAIMSVGRMIGLLMAATTSAFTCIMLDAIMVISAFCVFATLQESLAKEKKKQTLNMQTQATIFRSLARLFLDSRYRTILVIVFVSLVTCNGEGATEPSALIAIWGVDQHSLSVAFEIANCIGAAANIFLLPVLEHRVGNKGVLLLTSFIGMLALFGTGWSPSIYGMYACKYLDGLWSMYLPTITAVLYKITPEHLRSVSMGMRISLTYLAAGVGNALFGSIFTYFEQPRWWFSSSFPQSCLALGSIVWVFIIFAFLLIPKEVCASTSEELVKA